MPWKRRRRRGKRGRFPKPVIIPHPPTIDRFVPTPQVDPRVILIEPAEVEALRLVDREGQSQAEAGLAMGISRGTVWRLLQGARKKVAQALTEGRPLIVTTESDQAN